MNCPVCGVNKATQDKQYGILPCRICHTRQRTFSKPYQNIEFTSDEIKTSRKEYFKSTIQRYRDGQLSKEFVEAYPKRAKAMVKEGIHTESEIKKAKPVWGDVEPVGGWERTK